MKFITSKDVADFDPDQQDALLVEMQQAALHAFEAATSPSDLANAVTAFARAAEARVAVMPVIGGKRENERRAASNRRRFSVAGAPLGPTA